jgi:hypothetical protein
MKRKIIFCLSLLTVICFSATAQDDEEISTYSVGLKWAPAGLYFGKITLGGEYNMNMKKSITLTLGIPFNQPTTYKLDGDKQTITQKTFSAMAGYRVYLGQGNMHGLYFEPYVKYLKNNASFVTDADIDGSSRDFAVTSEYTGVGVGAQLGAQFLIGNHFTVDFYFLGPEANSAKHNIFMQELGSGAPWDAQESADAEDELNDTFKDVPLIGKKLKIDVNADQRSVSSEYKGFLPGFRFGLSFGYRF